MIEDIVKAVLPLVERVIPDKGQAAKFAQELAVLQHEREQAVITAQLALAKQEAAHRSVFVAGWRPAVGWACATAFACNFVVIPLWASLAPIWGWQAPITPLDMATIMPVLMGMLGMGGLRTWEKSRGLAK